MAIAPGDVAMCDIGGDSSESTRDSDGDGVRITEIGEDEGSEENIGDIVKESETDTD